LTNLTKPPKTLKKVVFADEVDQLKNDFKKSTLIKKKRINSSSRPVLNLNEEHRIETHLQPHNGFEFFSWTRPSSNLNEQLKRSQRNIGERLNDLMGQKTYLDSGKENPKLCVSSILKNKKTHLDPGKENSKVCVSSIFKNKPPQCIHPLKSSQLPVLSTGILKKPRRTTRVSLKQSRVISELYDLNHDLSRHKKLSFNDILMNILQKEVIEESLREMNQGKYYSVLNREKMLIYERIATNVIKSLCRETVSEFTSLEIKRYFLSKQKSIKSNDPSEHVTQEVISRYCEKETQNIAKEAISEILVEYLIKNFFERIFYNEYIPRQIQWVVKEASDEAIIESLFGDIIFNLSLEIGEPLSMLMIEEELQQVEQKELDSFFGKYLERLLTEEITQRIVDNIYDDDLEEKADEAHQRNRFDDADKATLQNFKLN
jgi:hypothetical protein